MSRMPSGGLIGPHALEKQKSGLPLPLELGEALLEISDVGHVGIVLAQLSRTGRTLAAEEAVRTLEDPHAVDSVPRDVDEISGPDGSEFVATQMDGAALKHENELLVVGVVVGRRAFAVLVGNDTDLHQVAAELDHLDVRILDVRGRLHVLSLVNRHRLLSFPNSRLIFVGPISSQIALY
jgi:hypothetical protein